MSRLAHVSASQIVEYVRCNRLWFANKILGWPQPRKPAAELGERIHKQMEDYYLTGKTPEHPSAAALVASGEIPPRLGPSAQLVEEPKNYELGISVAGVRLRGKIDLRSRPPAVLPWSAVWDWKSTSSIPHATAKTEGGGLERNPQMVIYGKAEFAAVPALEAVSFHHGYISTSRPGDFKVVSTEPLDRAHVDAEFARLEPVVVEMVATAAAAKTAEDVVPNPKACGDFGGCPYLERCSEGQKYLAAKRAQETEGFTMDGGNMNVTIDVNAFLTELQTKPAPSATKVLAYGINPPDAAKPDWFVANPEAAATAPTVAPDAAVCRPATPQDRLEVRVMALEAKLDQVLAALARLGGGT